MAGFWDRLFNGGGRSRSLALARGAELRGELARAAELFERGGRSDEAARVRRARALGVLAAMANVPVTASRRPPLLEAAADLEALGDFARAAEAYDRAHDVEGQARALARAGEIDRLDDLLEAEQARDRGARARRAGHEDFDAMVGSGRRREAFDRAQASPDAALRGRGLALHERRLGGTIVRVSLRGRLFDLVLGARVVVGRAPGSEGETGGAIEGTPIEASRPATGTITVASLSLSRSHLVIARRDGLPHVRDLGSRHGTTAGGGSLRSDVRELGEVPVGEGLELQLGGEVPCVIRPADELPGAVAIEIGGVRYVAPLGPATLGIGRWVLGHAPDGAPADGTTGAPRGGETRAPTRAPTRAWVELVTHDAPPAFAGGLRLSPRVTLLAGDAFSDEAGGDEVLRFPLRSSE